MSKKEYLTNDNYCPYYELESKSASESLCANETCPYKTVCDMSTYSQEDY